MKLKLTKLETLKEKIKNLTDYCSTINKIEITESDKLKKLLKNVQMINSSLNTSDLLLNGEFRNDLNDYKELIEKFIRNLKTIILSEIGISKLLYSETKELNVKINLLRNKIVRGIFTEEFSTIFGRFEHTKLNNLKIKIWLTKTN